MSLDLLRTLIDKAILTPQDRVCYYPFEGDAGQPWCAVDFRTPGPRSFSVISIHIQTGFTYYIGQSVCITTPEALDILAAYTRASNFLHSATSILTPLTPLNPYVV